MTQHIIILKNGEGDLTELPQVGSLAVAKRVAEAHWQPGLTVRIRTNRNTTWFLTRRGDESSWRSDTGRLAR
jgi:hypothetical protein